MATLVPRRVPKSGRTLINSSCWSCVAPYGSLAFELLKEWRISSCFCTEGAFFLFSPAPGLTNAIDKPASLKVVGFEVIGVGEFMVNKLCSTDCLGQMEICPGVNW